MLFRSSGSHKIIEDPEGYEAHWGYTNFEDKTVLDLGADYGSTTSWLFQKGAKKIIAVECDRERFDKLLQNYGDDKDVVCLREKILSGIQIVKLVDTYKPDLVKMDIEGDEINLLDVNKNEILSVKELLIEYHGKDVLEKLSIFLTRIGFNVKPCWINPWESGTCGVIYAVRKCG